MLPIRSLVSEHGSPLALLSRQAVRRQYRAIRQALRGVEIHYALKPLPLQVVAETLAAEGASFDLCSQGEIDLMKTIGVGPERCIHTHPIKRPQDLQGIVEYGCRTVVVDNAYELDKLLPYREKLDILLRLSFRSKDAVVDLSYKFGAVPDKAIDLLRLATDKGLKVKGLCFHVGSQCVSPAKHLEAIGFCRQIFSLAALDGIRLNTLDIGGGFPVPYNDPVMGIDEFCRPISEALERQFPGVHLIAEPGRYISAPAITCVASVMGKSLRGTAMWYYLDDGLYSSWSGKLYDHCDYPFLPLSVYEGNPPGEERLSVVAGPTCDSIDVVHDGIMLPEMNIGDLVVGPMMGAYTIASATDFNFFPRAKVVLVD